MTSRVPLRLRGGREQRLEPAALEHHRRRTATSSLGACVDRGKSLEAAQAGRRAGAVQRLDGLPLAIELAADPEHVFFSVSGPAARRPSPGLTSEEQDDVARGRTLRASSE